jgi:transposase
MRGISKRGNRYVRRLLIHGARSCVIHLDRSRDRLGAWIAKLQSRMHVNKVTVALAAKITRIAWVVPESGPSTNVATQRLPDRSRSNDCEARGG